MRETRRTLKAENSQLRSQIAVHNHVSRASLHDMLRTTRERNAHMVEEIKKLQERNASLEAEVTLLKAEKEAAKTPVT